MDGVEGEDEEPDLALLEEGAAAEEEDDDDEGKARFGWRGRIEAWKGVVGRG